MRLDLSRRDRHLPPPRPTSASGHLLHENHYRGHLLPRLEFARTDIGFVFTVIIIIIIIIINFA